MTNQSVFRNKVLNYLAHLSTNYVFDVSYLCSTDDFFRERDKSQFTKKLKCTGMIVICNNACRCRDANAKSENFVT